MMTMKQQQYKSKLGFLVQTEKMYEDTYIIDKNEEGAQEEEGGSEWQGMVKELKNDMKLNFNITKKELITAETKGQKEIIKMVKHNENKMEQFNQNYEAKIEELKVNNNTKIEELNQKNVAKIEELNQKMDSIETMLKQLI